MLTKPLEDNEASTAPTDIKLIDVFIKFYDSARQEAISRIALRDSAQLFYVASMGAYLSFVISHHFNSALQHEILPLALSLIAPLPLVSLIFTLIILHHHYFINRIGRFLSDELQFPAPYHRIVHWDTSRALTTQRTIDFGFRLIAQAALLCTPFLYDILFSYEYWNTIFDSGAVWIFIFMVIIPISACLYAYIIYLHVYIHLKIKVIIDNV